MGPSVGLRDDLYLWKSCIGSINDMIEDQNMEAGAWNQFGGGKAGLVS